MRTVSRIVSFIFHPLLFATYLLILLAVFMPAGLAPIKEDGHLRFIGLIFAITFVLPALNMALFKALGTIRSLSMISRNERIIPFSFTAVLYCLTTYLLYSRTQLRIDDNLMKFLIVIDMLVVAATVITFFYRISVHSLAVWAMIGILLPLNNVTEDGRLLLPTAVAIVIAGAVMSARLQLNAHTPREVMIGAITGLLLGFGSVVVLF